MIKKLTLSEQQQADINAIKSKYNEYLNTCKDVLFSNSKDKDEIEDADYPITLDKKVFMSKINHETPKNPAVKDNMV